MGVILAKFRKEKSTQQVLEALQEKIDTLETYTVNTQEQKKRIVGNFLALSIGVYVIAFVVFYFIYFPPTWKERFVYFIPLLLFPIIIILLRYLFTWYFQRKLNKNSKKLTVLRGEKKKILEQVMDKETYKVAVNLLARFADKPSKTAIALSSATPSKHNQTQLNRSLQTTSSSQRTTQSTLTPALSPNNINSKYLSLNTPRLGSKIATTSPPNASSGTTQQLRRRTPFPIVNQQAKGAFDRIVDVLIGDGPQDRFAMICKECFSHNGMALKDDFEYTTFRCAFCNVLNPARKARPVAPRLSVTTAAAASVANDSSDSSDPKDDKDDSGSDDSADMNLKANMTEFSTPMINISNLDLSSEKGTTATVRSSTFLDTEAYADVDEEKQETRKTQQPQPQNGEMSKKKRKDVTEIEAATTKLLEIMSLTDKAEDEIEKEALCAGMSVYEG